MEKSRDMKKSVRFLILSGGALVLGFIVGVLLAPVLFETPEFASSTSEASAPVSIPDVVGMSRQDARREIESANLILAAQWSEYGEIETMGTVSRQDPPAGTLTPRGGSVTIFWDMGPRYREFHPSQLVGITVSDAEELVADWHLYSIGRSFVPHPRIPEGIVIGVSPWEPGSLRVMTSVRLLVSTGWSGIPFFVGMAQADAVEIAEDVRLFAQVEDYITSDDSLVGRVLHQNIDAGESFVSGDTIILQVGIVDSDWGTGW